MIALAAPRVWQLSRSPPFLLSFSLSPALPLPSLDESAITLSLPLPLFPVLLAYARLCVRVRVCVCVCTFPVPFSLSPSPPGYTRRSPLFLRPFTPSSLSLSLFLSCFFFLYPPFIPVFVLYLSERGWNEPRFPWQRPMRASNVSLCLRCARFASIPPLPFCRDS